MSYYTYCVCWRLSVEFDSNLLHSLLCELMDWNWSGAICFDSSSMWTQFTVNLPYLSLLTYLLNCAISCNCGHHLKHNFPALLTCKLDKSKLFHFARADWAHLSSKHSTLFSVCKRMPLKFAFRAVCVCVFYIIAKQCYSSNGTFFLGQLQRGACHCQTSVSPPVYHTHCSFEVARVTPRLHIYGVSTEGKHIFAASHKTPK